MAVDISTPLGQALAAEGQSRGFSPFDIAGSLGNAQSENGLATSGTPGDNGTAFGGFQWRGDRFNQLKALADQMGKPWTDPSVQAKHWFNEQEAAGNKGATSVDDANDNTIDSLRPAGWTQRAGDNTAVDGYGNRLANSTAAYAALTGGAADGTSTNQPDPRQFQANADGSGAATNYNSGAAAAAAVDPTSDAGGYNIGAHMQNLGAALMARDNPSGAAVIQAQLAAQRAAFQANKPKDQTWTADKAPSQNADGTWMNYKTNDSTGQRVGVPTPANQIPKADDPNDTPPTRQEVQAQIKQNEAVQNINQLTPVRDAVNTLRDALQKGTFTVGPDKQGQMVIDNITGNSTENDRYLKSMQSNIINAASVVAQSQKGSMTNFKFAKDMEQVMPSFAAQDPKAAYEALSRVAQGIGGAYNGNANAATGYGKSFSRLNTMMDPNTGEQVPIADYYKDKVKTYGDREKAFSDAAPAFLNGPGRSTPTQPAGGLFGHVMGQ